MNVLFLTLLDFSTITEHNIYTDLLREFVNHGHRIYTISPVEKRMKQGTHIVKEKDSTILKLKIGNIQKTNVIEKGISTITIESTYIRAIKRWFGKIKFDLVLYTTPPITFGRAVAYVKKRDGAKTYLLLKDIFPQNAVDMGMLSKNGIKGVLYRHFRKKEKQLYVVSDKIGCMSMANLEYIKKHNLEVSQDKLEICPNTIDNVDIQAVDKKKIRRKFHIPQNKLIFIYGGNFGKPQNVDYILRILKESKRYSFAHFVMCGAGTDFYKIQAYKEKGAENVTVIGTLPYIKYVELLRACDIGMIFLDYNFTIPNFPSRLLDYLNYGMPVIAATDKNTDLSEIIIKYKFGWWCESNRVENYMKLLEQIGNQIQIISQKGELGKKYMMENYTTGHAYEVIVNSYNSVRKEDSEETLWKNC
ncbi:MAG: glycosyltransferase family 4 protein [Lachnospiraceae bacterium]|nr:glycosyltransferase family 4 protein [Lachnospiraceae bacterium]